MVCKCSRFVRCFVDRDLSSRTRLRYEIHRTGKHTIVSHPAGV